MIIFGSREARLLTKVFDDGFCTHCGQKGNIACTVFSRHAHVMWIPFFPIGKRTTVWCQQCGTEYKQLFQVPPVLQNQIQDFQKSQKAPLWQWVGLLLIIGFFVSAIITGIIEDRNTKKFFKSPDYKDVYCISYEGVYSLMYLCDIRGDSIFFLHNKYNYSKLSSVIKQLHRPHFYLKTVYGYSREDLNKEFYEDKTIHIIWRNLPYQTKEMKLSEEERKLFEEDDEEEEEVEE